MDRTRSARDLVDLSRAFLLAERRGESSEGFVDRLAGLEEASLAALDDGAAKAFWIDLYNAFVQRHLREEPALYEDGRRFFREPRITVAGTALSLDDVEHGILRSSKWKYGLGYLPRPFPDDFERTHRLPAVDPRIHFALNCGAESCPPIAAYTAESIDDELDRSTRSFLEETSTYDAGRDELRVSRLFLYYRGDFGGRRGIYEFLERYDVIEEGERPRVRYDDYDWTLHVGMYREDETGAPGTGERD